MYLYIIRCLYVSYLANTFSKAMEAEKPAVTLCAQHNEKFTFYCQNCDLLVCNSCVDVHGEYGHNLRAIEKAFPLVAKKCEECAENLHEEHLTLRQSTRRSLTEELHKPRTDLTDMFTTLERIVESAKQKALSRCPIEESMQNEQRDPLIRRIEKQVLQLKQVTTGNDLLDVYNTWTEGMELLNECRKETREKLSKKAVNLRRSREDDYLGDFIRSLFQQLAPESFLSEKKLTSHSFVSYSNSSVHFLLRGYFAS